MSEFERNTAYLYLYESGRPIRGIGFVKRTRRLEDDKLMVHINGFYTAGSAEGKVYAILERGDHAAAVEVGAVMIGNSEGECRLMLPQGVSEHIGIAVVIEEQECIGWYDGSMSAPNIEYPEMGSKEDAGKELSGKMDEEQEADGERIRTQESDRERIRTQESDGEREKGQESDGERIRTQESDRERTKAQEGESDREEKEGEVLTEAEQDIGTDESAWGRLKQVFPIVYPFEYVVDADYLSITPSEIRQLDVSEHILLNNSFLQHAYYNYKYLIIGKKHRKHEQEQSASVEDEVYYIGVPGIYHDREIMMAKMFGFEHFLSAKKEQPNMGCFGYYMKQVKV